MLWSPARCPAPLPEDAEGWSQLDGWGAWECAVSCIVPMEEVAGPYRKAWGAALVTVRGGLTWPWQPAPSPRWTGP